MPRKKTPTPTRARPNLREALTSPDFLSPWSRLHRSGSVVVKCRFDIPKTLSGEKLVAQIHKHEDAFSGQLARLALEKMIARHNPSVVNKVDFSKSYAPRDSKSPAVTMTWTMRVGCQQELEHDLAECIVEALSEIPLDKLYGTQQRREPITRRWDEGAIPLHKE